MIEHTRNLNENRIQNIGNRGVGRPKGLTQAKSLRRKVEYLKERENHLRKEGVRRSARLNKEYSQLTENITLPDSFEAARNSNEWENWKKAMEHELESLNAHNVWEVCEVRGRYVQRALKLNGFFSIKETIVTK